MVKEAILLADEGINPENPEVERWMDTPRTLQPANPLQKIRSMIGQITTLVEKQDFVGAKRVFLQAKTLISMGLMMAEQHKNGELKAGLQALKQLLDEEERKLEILQSLEKEQHL